jgi:flavodoxin short chain
MAKALIVYGSTTGNTESVAERISRSLQQTGIDVSLKNVTTAKVEELGGEYDITILGSSTWGDTDIEFQEDFAPFFEELDKAKLQGKKVAIFGCGDTSYEHFCGAVDLLEEKMGQLGALLVNEPLRIDGDPGDAQSDIDSWTEEVGKKALV